MEQNLHFCSEFDNPIPQEQKKWFLDSQPNELDDFYDFINTENAMVISSLYNNVVQQGDTSDCSETKPEDLRDSFNTKFAEQKANKIVPALNDVGISIDIEVSNLICHDKEVNKIYTKPKEQLNLILKYQQDCRDSECFALCMLVYKTQPVVPVQTCANHRSVDSATDEREKFNALRCRNKDATYVGTQDGTHLDDRLGILVPLYNGKPNLDQIWRVTPLGLEFICQNSCMGRKEMCLIIYLLNSNFEVLGNKVLDVKVCACPKRDMKKDQDERKNGSKALKRRKDPNSDLDIPVGKKLLKLEANRESLMGNENLKIPTNGIRMIMDFPDMDTTLHVLQCAINAVAGKIASDPANPLVVVWKQHWVQFQEQKRKLMTP